MANIKSSKKRIRVIENKTARNKRIKLRLKEILKKFEEAVANGDKETAREMLATAEKKLMQAASKGTVHKNNAARKVSRLTKKFSNEFGVDALKEKPEAKKASKPAAKKAAAKKEEAPKEEKPEEKVEEKADEKEAEEKPKKKAAPKKKSTKKESAEEAETEEKADDSEEKTEE